MNANWGEKFVIYLYDKDNNILGYSVNSSSLIKEAIKKVVDKTDIKEVNSGIIPFYNAMFGNLEVTVIREKLPSEMKNVSTMFISSKLKGTEINDILHRYLTDNAKKEYRGAVFNSSGLSSSNVNFNVYDYYILFFDSNKDLVGYHILE